MKKKKKKIYIYICAFIYLFVCLFINKETEKIKRVAIKMVPCLKDLLYEERLSKLKLPIQHDRRNRGDLLSVSKEMEKIETIYLFRTRETKGNMKKTDDQLQETHQKIQLSTKKQKLSIFWIQRSSMQGKLIIIGLEENWLKVNMQTGQYEYSCVHVCHNGLNATK